LIYGILYIVYNKLDRLKRDNLRMKWGLRDMTLQERIQQVTSIKEMVQDKISHYYLKQLIEVPHIDEDRILLLVNSLAGQDLSHQNFEKFVTTAMLVQIALDTHDKISNLQEPLTQRQLTILAGDYFSGLYYKILADIEHVPLIRVLAEGIKTVNEYKILVYQSNDSHIDEFLVHLKKAESTIVSKFSQFFDSQSIGALAEEVLLVNRLLREKENAVKGEASVLFEALMRAFLPSMKQATFQQLPLEKKALLFQECEKYIEQSIGFISSMMTKIPKLNQLLEQRLDAIMSRYPATSNLYAEEG
jgi:heptaprenyl diphosphate synthase